MTLPASGSISLAQVNTELGLSSSASINLGQAGVRSLFGKASGAIALGDGYGKANVTPTVEYLVVAGGGAGNEGGGGAGGYRTATGYAVTAGSPITVTVGAGGNHIGNNSGSNSVFGTITSIGGGHGGGNYAGGDPVVGGSGGGGHSSYGAGAAGTAGQGNAGSGLLATGTGGGGAGSAASGNTRGAGASSSISGSAVTYAAGGDNFAPSTTPGSGGSNSFYSAGGTDGQTGIVIIRYPNTYPAAASTTGSPTIANTGGYRIYSWTSSGSITF